MTRQVFSSFSKNLYLKGVGARARGRFAASAREGRTYAPHFQLPTPLISNYLFMLVHGGADAPPCTNIKNQGGRVRGRP
ncbi:hypothetical protein KDAU_18080 [Dictyobacter aurantiacus]|uniref:Uncharacterized protein n=1 Tax=Dictyobacter aurantiacus TaxID=1936993 RepID=A0A401ZCA1_9CHLR|nr:hypothetical protein KDAU_18080 [Dictyobacter aurantiacus]